MLHPCVRGDVATPRATRLCAESITRGRGGAGHEGSSWEKVGKMRGICTHFMQGTSYIYVSSRTRGAAGRYDGATAFERHGPVRTDSSPALLTPKHRLLCVLYWGA